MSIILHMSRFSSHLRASMASKIDCIHSGRGSHIWCFVRYLVEQYTWKETVDDFFLIIFLHHECFTIIIAFERILIEVDLRLNTVICPIYIVEV